MTVSGKGWRAPILTLPLEGRVRVGVSWQPRTRYPCCAIDCEATPSPRHLRLPPLDGEGTRVGWGQTRQGSSQTAWVETENLCPDRNRRIRELRQAQNVVDDQRAHLPDIGQR